jgi:hypothetical protein
MMGRALLSAAIKAGAKQAAKQAAKKGASQVAKSAVKKTATKAATKSVSKTKMLEDYPRVTKSEIDRQKAITKYESKSAAGGYNMYRKKL